MNRYLFILIITLTIASCKKDNSEYLPIIDNSWEATPYVLELPPGFPPMDIPASNPMTIEGVELGRFLFYERKLSSDNSISCADCHFAQFGFSDTAKFSIGVNGTIGERHAMVLQNLGYSDEFFWDGRAATLEDQGFDPVTNPLEMNSSWVDVEVKLNADEMYKTMFYNAFGISQIDSVHVVKAIAQFERTLLSGNSRFDQWSRGELLLTSDEFEGFDSFRSLTGGDCFHCHAHSSRLFTDHSFKNNGLDILPLDDGRGGVNGDPNDLYKFKVPTLRNIEYSAPYMHDGRFSNLDEVIDFYSDQVQHSSPNISPQMEFSSTGGVALNPQEKFQLKAFLKTLSDPDFINNPDFSSPF